MVNKFLAVCMAALVLAGCDEDDGDDLKRRLIELEVINQKQSERLEASSRLLNELKRSGGVIRRQQVVTRPVKFSQAGMTLQAVRDRKRLKCGGNADLPGFGYLDPDDSEFVGFDIDLCRAIGAAALGSEGADLVEIIPLTSKLRFAALQSGEIDVLTRNTTWTMARDTELRTDFAGIMFYDGQGVLVRKDDEILKLSDLEGRSICVQGGSTSERNMADYIETVGLTIEMRAFDDRMAALTQYEEGACDAYTGDKSSLMAQRTLLNKASDHTILVDEISQEPLGPVVRHLDDNWKDIVFWTGQCLLNAEALGVSQASVEQMKETSNLRVRRLLGLEGELGQKLGLSNDFCYQIIYQVGNYKDIYDRHLGTGSKFNLLRGLNDLHTNGGIHYPIPFK